MFAYIFYTSRRYFPKARIGINIKIKGLPGARKFSKKLNRLILGPRGRSWIDIDIDGYIEGPLIYFDHIRSLTACFLIKWSWGEYFKGNAWQQDYIRGDIASITGQYVYSKKTNYNWMVTTQRDVVLHRSEHLVANTKYTICVVDRLSIFYFYDINFQHQFIRDECSLFNLGSADFESYRKFIGTP